MRSYLQQILDREYQDPEVYKAACERYMDPDGPKLEAAARLQELYAFRDNLVRILEAAELAGYPLPKLLESIRTL